MQITENYWKKNNIQHNLYVLLQLERFSRNRILYSDISKTL